MHFIESSVFINSVVHSVIFLLKSIIVIVVIFVVLKLIILICSFIIIYSDQLRVIRSVLTFISLIV